MSAAAAAARTSAATIRPMTEPGTRPRILTGDTPTGRLHLGHWVGSVRRRVELQRTHDCYFIIANMHAFTTRADRAEEIRSDCLEIARDYLGAGIDPAQSTIFLQSEIPAIAELTFLFAMLLPFNRVMRNVVGSPRAVRLAARAAAVWPGAFGALIRYAGDAGLR